MIKLKIYENELGCIDAYEFEELHECRKCIESFLHNRVHPPSWGDYYFRVWVDDVEEHFDIVYTAKVEWSK